MAVTIVATAGSATANSFVTLAEALAYTEGRLNASAFNTNTDSQNRALVEAARELDRLTWRGYRADATQALSWPRTGVVDIDAPIDATPGVWTGQPEYDEDEIPDRVKNAQIELAVEFLRAGTTDIAGENRNRGVIRRQTGPIETEWQPSIRREGIARYPRVISYVKPLLAGSGEVVRS